MSADSRSTEQALERYLELHRQGVAPTPADFVRQHPECADELESALEALLLLERATAAPIADAMVPERVGAFRVVREIGRGGMGVVLEAVEEPLQRRVALKVLPAELVSSASARARFQREAAIAARLDHSGIATVYGAGVAGDRPWIAMRFVEGRTLSACIAEARDRGERCVRLGATATRERDHALAVAVCIAQVARALRAAHEQGVVHRDIKPSNIIVTPDGSPVLLDFGLAIAESSGDPTLTRAGELPGTPAYLAPESISGELMRHDAQSDVYALGVTLHECLTLRRPFEGPTPMALYNAIVVGSATDVRERNPDIPRDLAVVVATAMARDRSRRYSSAAAFANDLEACVAGRPIAARPVPFHGRLSRWARREPRQATLAGLSLVLLLTAAVFGGTWWSSRAEVRAAERVARREALETAIADGFYAHSLGRRSEADAAFARALALDAQCIEALVGSVFLAITDDGSKARARLARLPANTPALDALMAVAEGRAPPTAPVGTEFDGATSLELSIRGMCWQLAAGRLAYSDQPKFSARALSCFTEAILRAPAPRPIYYEQRAAAAQRVGDPKAARSAASALLELWPNSPRALMRAGQALYAFDPAAARRTLERAIELQPDFIDAYNMIAVTCLESGDIDATEEWSRRALAIAPNDASLLYLHGMSLTRQNCDDDAQFWYQRAVARNRGLLVAWGQLAAYALFDGRLDESIPLYEFVLQLDPGADRMRVMYAAALELTGDAAGARANFATAAARMYPVDLNYWVMLTLVMTHLRAYECVLATAEFGLAANPGHEALESTRVEANRELEARR